MNFSKVEKTKDKQQELFIDSVYQNLFSVAEPHILKDIVEPDKATEIRFVSYEEALKQLLDTKEE